MNICGDGHEEICFEVNYCPLCTYISDKDSEIKDLTDEIKSYEADLDEKLEKLSEYEDIFEEVKQNYPEFCI